MAGLHGKPSWPRLGHPPDGMKKLSVAGGAFPGCVGLWHEGLIRESRVPLDTRDLLMQMDVDVLDRMRSHFRRGAWAG